MEADPERVLKGSALACFACGVRGCVVWTVSWGGEAYARRGALDETGTKQGCPTERFARPGAYEVELGIPVGNIVTELGGGLKDGSELTALQVSGALDGFLAPDALDVSLTTADLAACGAALGHVGLVAFDQRVTPEEVLRHIWQFAAES